MFWDLEGWLEPDVKEASVLIRDLDAFLRKRISLPDSHDAQPLLLPPETKGSTDTSQLPVLRVRSRSLPFYKNGWRLHEFTCNVEELRSIAVYRTELVGYEDEARLFALAGPNPSEDWILLNWTSAPIYEANQPGRAGLVDFGESLELAREYLIFFCSFLGAEGDGAGSIAPFLVPQNANALLKDAITSFDDLEFPGFERFAMPPAAEDADPFDLGQSDQQKSQESAGIKSTGANEAAQKDIPTAVRDAFSGFETNPKRMPGNDMRFEALIWYAGVLYKSVVSVEPKSENNVLPGLVRMIEDNPIAGDAALPVPRYEVIELLSGLRLLCRRQRREEIAIADLLSRIASISTNPGAPENASPGSGVDPLRGLRIRGTREIVFPQNIPVSLIFEDVEFIGFLKLDDSVFEHSLTFKDCRFLQGLSALNATVKGSFSLTGSRIDGMTRVNQGEIGEAPPGPSLRLQGLKVERSLFADRVQVSGRIRCQWMHVGGAFRGRGLRVHPRPNIDDSEVADLSHAVIEGPLDLSAQPKTNDRPGSERRTRLDGECCFEGLQAAMLNLRGAYMHTLNLTACRIDRTLDATPIGHSEKIPGWRTWIQGELNLTRGETGFIDISGARIRDRVWAIEHQLKGSLWAELQNRYRTRFGGTLTLSGARIQGDVELSGSQVDGEVHFITGNCGRFRAGVEWWADEEKNESIPRLCVTEASGLLFQDVTIAGGLLLAGIALHGKNAEHAQAGMRTFNLRVGGAVEFWESNRARTLENLCPVRDERDQRLVTFIRETILAVEARVEGDLDFSGVNAAGGIDLSRSSIKGKIALDNARIGHLRACDKGEPYADGKSSRKTGTVCACESLTMNAARIAGDVDLRGLEIREPERSLKSRHREEAGSLLARDIKVEGVFRLATEESPSEFSPQAHLKNGRIDLQGLVAPQLVMSAENIDNFGGGTEKKPFPAIRLTRAAIGQLCLSGFKKDGSGTQFPRTIDLMAIHVDDWGIRPDTEAIALLEATGPHWHDGRNYVDIERRLAGTGETKLANEVYRLLERRRAKDFWGKLGYAFHWAFSGNRTRPLRMFAWLVGLTLLVGTILSDYRNVEFATDPPAYELERDWNIWKTTGMALSYAIPVFGSARSEPVRARLVGPACAPWAPSPLSLDGGRKLPCPSILPLSPHDFALIVSMIQLALWVFLAGSLPTIIRRRS